MAVTGRPPMSMRRLPNKLIRMDADYVVYDVQAGPGVEGPMRSLKPARGLTDQYHLVHETWSCPILSRVRERLHGKALRIGPASLTLRAQFQHSL